MDLRIGLEQSISSDMMIVKLIFLLLEIDQMLILKSATKSRGT